MSGDGSILLADEDVQDHSSSSLLILAIDSNLLSVREAENRLVTDKVVRSPEGLSEADAPSELRETTVQRPEPLVTDV